MSYQVFYSPILLEILVTLIQVIESTIKKEMGLCYLEFCVLTSVGLMHKPVQLSELASQLPIKPNTVAVITTKLEKRGYLIKSVNSHDRRMVLLSLTQGTNEAILRTLHTIFRELRNTLWQDLRLSEIKDLLKYRPLIAQNLGIGPCLCRQYANAPMSPAYFLIVYSIMEYIKKTIKEQSNLNINEYRILLFLMKQSSCNSQTSISNQINRDLGTVSRAIRKLEQLKLINVNAKEHASSSDKRKNNTCITQKGTLGIVLLNEKLNQGISRIYGDLTPPNQAKINELHMRIYMHCMNCC